MKYLGIWDFVWVPVLLMVVYWRAQKVQEDNIGLNPAYRFYNRALIVKVFGGLIFALLYVFYYGGGDTTTYWMDSGALASLITRNPLCYLDILSGNLSIQNFYCFDFSEFRPYSYYLKDAKTYTVTRLTSPLYFLTIDSFLGCTILVSLLSFGGIWRLYLVFCEEYPKLTKELAYGFLFMPSVVFWGSGIMKDTYTLAAVCWMTSSVYGLIIKRREIAWNVVYVIISASIIISIKPYVFVALMPGIMLWVVFNRIQSMKNRIIRVLAAPIMIMIAIVGAAAIFSQTSSTLGEYGSFDSVVDKAIATQEDLKRDAYAGNSFDIGTIDPSVQGILSKAPQAIFAGLFRPTLLDTKNIVMLISALENTMLMLFMLYVLFKVGVFHFFRLILANHMILFSFVFALFFAFAVGLTTSNFGSLVRYKIQALPFFLSSLYMINYHREKEKQAS